MPWISGKRGAYRVMWREGGRHSPIKASRTFEDRTEALAELRERKVERDAEKAGRRAPTSRTPIPVLLDRWKASRVSERRAKPEHCDVVIDIIKPICEEMKWGFAHDITGEGLDRWRGLKDAGKGTDRPLQYIKGFLRWCRRVARIRVQDSALDILPRAHRRVKPPPLLTVSQVAAILARSLEVGAAISPGFRDSVSTAIEHLSLYGCRPIDISRLRVGDWNPVTREIVYRGTKNGDDIEHAVHDLHSKKLDALCAGRKPDDPLFLDPFGRQWYINKRGAAGGLVDWYRANIGRPLEMKAKDGVTTGVLHKSQLGIYVVKDFACSNLIRASGGNRRLAMTMSGHRSEDAFDKYVTTNADGQRQLIAAIPEVG